MRYGYARVSTRGQKVNGASLDDQRDQLERNGVEPDRIFSDAYTGTKMDRPAFDKMIALLAEGDELVVCKLDRFARTAPEGAMLVRELVSRGVKVNILNMGVADNTPMGKVMVSVMLAFAEFERDMIVERTTSGKAYKREHDPNYKEGRPKKTVPADDLKKFLEKQKGGEMTVRECCAELGIGRTTWYELVKGVTE